MRRYQYKNYQPLSQTKLSFLLISSIVNMTPWSNFFLNSANCLFFILAFLYCQLTNVNSYFSIHKTLLKLINKLKRPIHLPGLKAMSKSIHSPYRKISLSAKNNFYKEFQNFRPLHDGFVYLMNGRCNIHQFQNTLSVSELNDVLDLCLDEGYGFAITAQKSIYLIRNDIPTLSNVLFVRGRDKLIYSSGSDIITKCSSSYCRSLGLLCVVIKRSITIITLNLEFSFLKQDENVPVVEVMSSTLLSAGNIDISVIWKVDENSCLFVGNTMNSYLSGWKLRRIKNDNGILVWSIPTPRVDTILLKDHNSWITALSSGTGDFYCAGDAHGNLLTWIRNDKNDIQFKFQQTNYTKSPITVITTTSDPIPSIWIGTSNGEISMSTIDLSLDKPSLLKTRFVRTHAQASISSIWIYSPNDQTASSTSTSATTPGSSKLLPQISSTGSLLPRSPSLISQSNDRQDEWVLRSVSDCDGVIWEHTLNDSILSLFPLTPSIPLEAKMQHNLVTACAFMPQFELIVSAGGTSSFSLWNATDGTLIQIIETELGNIITMLAVERPADEDTVLLFLGHRNGSVTTYVMTSPSTPANQSNDEITHPSVTTRQTDQAPFQSHSLSSLDLLNGDEPNVTRHGVPTPTQYLRQSDVMDNTSFASQNNAPMERRWVVSFDKISSLSPLPVSDIICSNNREYVLFIYAKCLVLIYNINTSLILSQMKLPQDVMSVSILQKFDETPFSYYKSQDDSHSDGCDSNVDDICLVLQNPYEVRIINVLRSRILLQLSLSDIIRYCSGNNPSNENKNDSQQKMSVKSQEKGRSFENSHQRFSQSTSMMQSMSTTSSLAPSPPKPQTLLNIILTKAWYDSPSSRGDERKIFTLCLSNQGHIIVNIQGVNLSNQSIVKILGKMDLNEGDLVSGLEIVPYEKYFVVAAWSFRQILVLKLSRRHDTVELDLLKSSSFQVTNMKARILNVSCKEPTVIHRYNRVQLVLSDGFSETVKI